MSRTSSAQESADHRPNSRDPGPEPDPEDIPTNFIFRNFPDQDTENAARWGVIDAVNLASAGLSGAADLNTSYYRYFRANEIDLVQKVFDNIMNEAIFAPCPDAHTVEVWYDDTPPDIHGCAEGVDAYHVTTREGVNGINIVLLPTIFSTHTKHLDDIHPDTLDPYASEAMKCIGLTILHHLVQIPELNGMFDITDTDIKCELEKSPSNPEGVVKATNPYFAMLANKQDEVGANNTDNYVFFAVESYFMRERDVAGFEDAPAPMSWCPSPLPPFPRMSTASETATATTTGPDSSSPEDVTTERPDGADTEPKT